MWYGVVELAKNIGIIAKVRYILPQCQVRLLYLTLVEPYLTYCCLIWTSDVHSIILPRILKLQKKYCRIVTFAHFQKEDTISFYPQWHFERGL